MPWRSWTRADIEAVMRQRLQKCKDARDELAAELRILDAATRDAAGTSDGTHAARQARKVNEAIGVANSRYAAALAQFTEFIVDGKLPPED